MKMTRITIMAIGLLTFGAAANAECVAPDIYTNGNGIDYSGLCTALSTGEVAASTASIDASTAELTRTQLKSYALQAEQLAKQVLETQNTIIQAELLVRQFEENPLEVVAPNANQIVENHRRIMRLANEIANNVPSVASNALRNLENPDTIGLGKGSRFQIWSDARRQQALSAYEQANRYLKEAPERNANINKLITSSAAAKGDTANLKIVSSSLTQSMLFLQGIQETLNNIMTGQATESGTRIDDEIAAAKADQYMLNKGIGDPLKIPKDRYRGPGSQTSKPF